MPAHTFIFWYFPSMTLRDRISRNLEYLFSFAFKLFYILRSIAASNMSQYTVLLTVLLLSCCRVLLAGKSCYNPDQTVPSNPYYPCNTASGVDSACCGFGDQCTENGYCFGSAGYIYRGGCTDITWQSANCAHHCKDGTQSQPQEDHVLPTKIWLTL